MLCVRRQVNTVMFERKYMPCHKSGYNYCNGMLYCYCQNDIRKNYHHRVLRSISQLSGSVSIVSASQVNDLYSVIGLRPCGDYMSVGCGVAM